jgi:hypothetical protein
MTCIFYLKGFYLLIFLDFTIPDKRKYAEIRDAEIRDVGTADKAAIQLVKVQPYSRRGGIGA